MRRVFLSFVLFGAILSAAPVNVTLLNAGNGAVDATQQYYVGPYTLTLNGVATPAMCMDDFIDNNVGTSWKANVTAVNGPDFSNTYLGNSGISQYNTPSGEAYAEEAYLFSLITRPGADQADIQEAAWILMDPANANPVYLNNGAVQNYLFDAIASLNTFDASGYSIISNTDGVGQFGSTQEFMVASAPEPASFALFGAGLLAAGAMRFRRRKQVSA